MVGPRNAAVERYAYRLLDKAGMASLGTHAEEDHKDGITKLVAPIEKFSVFIDATGFETQTVGPFEANNIPAAIDVRLAAIPGVRGTVTLDGKPVGGARVRAVKAVGTTSNLEINGYRAIAYNSIVAQGATAQDGTFFLPIRSDDNYYIRAQSEGFAESEIGPIRIVGKRGWGPRAAPRSGRDPRGARHRRPRREHGRRHRWDLARRRRPQDPARRRQW